MFQLNPTAAKNTCSKGFLKACYSYVIVKHRAQLFSVLYYFHLLGLLLYFKEIKTGSRN